MTHDVLETAIREGIPFAINMADGRQYEVRSRERIFLGKTWLIHVDERDLPHVLPLLTMTGVSYLPKENDAAHS
jgi:ribosomal protein S4E